MQHHSPVLSITARAGRAPSRQASVVLHALEPRALMSFTYSDLAGLFNPPGPTAFSDDYNGPIAIIGDVDGDGAPDVLAGLSGGWSNPKTGGEFAGAAVFSGKTGSFIRAHQPGVRAFGWSVAALGDINGDGKPDYGIGTSAGFGGPTVTVYDGTSGALMHTFTLGDTGQPDQPGALVAGPGDIDSDGYADVLVGYPGQNQARVYSGRTGGVLQTYIGTDYGVTERFGLAVAGGAGLDSADVLAGADLTHTGDRDFLIAGPGRILAFSGTRAEDFYFITLTDPVPAGQSVNITIVRDVILDDTDAVVMIRNNTLTVHDGATGGAVRTITGPSDAPFTGGFAVVGDYNGDGARDLAIASSTYSTAVDPGGIGFSPQGAIGIYSSATGDRLDFLTDISSLTVVNPAGGVSVRNIGDYIAAADFDGDGFPDLLSSSEFNPAYGGQGVRSLIRFDGSFLVNAPVIHGQGLSPGAIQREMAWGSLGAADFLYLDGRVVFLESLEGLSRGDRILGYAASTDTMTLAVARGGQISDTVLWVGRPDLTRRGLLVLNDVPATGGPAGDYALTRVAAVLEDAAYLERTRDGTTPTTWRVHFLDVAGVVVGEQTYLFDGAAIAAEEGVGPDIDEIVAAIAADDPSDGLVLLLGQDVVRLEGFRPHAVSGRGIVVGLAQLTGDPEPRPYAIRFTDGQPGTPLALRVPEGGTGWMNLRLAMDGSVTGQYTTSQGGRSIFVNYFQALHGGSEAEVADLRSSDLFGAPDGFFDRDYTLQTAADGGGEFTVRSIDPATGLPRFATVNDINHFPSRRSGLGSTFVASADGLAVVVSGPAGEITVFYRVSFSSAARWRSAVVTSREELQAGEPDVPLHTGPMTTWSIPGSNLPYIAIATADGLILLEPTVYLQGGVGGGPAFPFFAYNYRNLTEEIPGSEAITQSLSTMMPLNGLRLLSGLTADGDLVLYGLTRPIDTAVTELQEPFTWAYANLYDQVLRPGGLAEPDFDVATNGDLVSYVTAWGGLNIAGISGGDVISFWTAPGLTGWQVANISDAVAPTIPDPTGLHHLAVYLTPWGGINLVGGDRLDVYWWAPGLGGNWRFDTLARYARGAPELRAETLTTYVAPWGGLNIAGLDAQDQLWIYWWAPDTPDWRAESLDASLTPGDALIPHTGSLESSVSAEGEFNIFARTRYGDPIRYSWSPTQPWTLENLNFPMSNPG